MEIGFDLIGDLHLGPDDSFNWEGKATSLYCIVAGNISDNLRMVHQVLSHLCKFYQGVFYVPGLDEYKTCLDHETRTKELANIIKKLPKVAMLYHHVVIIDGVAIIGCNGWNADNPEDIDIKLINSRLEDISYLDTSITKLQTHLDVKRIVIVTACIPNKQLYFGQTPSHVEDHIYPAICLSKDTEMKITHWAFGGYEKTVETFLDGIKFINNPYKKTSPYYAKRLTLKD